MTIEVSATDRPSISGSSERIESIAAVVERTGAEVDFAGSGSNTILSYMYRDADNFKAYGSVTFAGRMSEGDLVAFAAVLNDDAYFVPGQVGIEDLQHTFNDGEAEWVDDRDHPWHELTGVEYTDRDPTDGRTVDQFVAEVRAVEWSDRYLPPEYPSMVRRHTLRSIQESDVLDRSAEVAANGDSDSAVSESTCGSCGRRDSQPHAGDCIVALEQDAADGDIDAQSILGLGQVSEQSGRLDIAHLPVFTPRATDLLRDRSETAVFASEERISVVGRSEAGDRIVGLAGAAYTNVDASAFRSPPRIGDVLLVSRESDGRDVARPIDRGQFFER